MELAHVVRSEKSGIQDLVPSKKKIKIPWVYLVEIAGTWAQILSMALCHGFKGNAPLSLMQLWRQLMLMSEQTVTEGKELRSGVRNNCFMTPFWKKRHTFFPDCLRRKAINITRCKKREDTEGDQSAGFVLLLYPLSGE